MSVEIRDVHIEYPDRLIFDAVNLSVADHELVAIHSQVLDGGTSLLKGVAGLLKGVTGQVLFEGADLLKLPPSSLYFKIGYVYEENGLLSIYNIRQNICLPLQFHTTMSAADIFKAVEQVCDLLGISRDLLDMRTHELNDVQTRIINLARALVTHPTLLLIDELEGGMSDDYLTTTISHLREHQREHPMAIIATTSSEVILAQADRIYKIENHDLVAESRQDLP
jgi:ABC-type transporter Mla maintaining outer membrane lipid asymmetry ATPase subunit MlaF